jgi:glyoxylase-like metal-dependent hydrolase (beta-lactamase superfamily II)
MDSTTTVHTAASSLHRLGWPHRRGGNYRAARRLISGEKSMIAAARRKGGMANVTTQALRGNVSALIGSGGNIAVLTGKDGKLIIDSGYAGSREKISAALDAISHDPIKHLVNTHWHFDHTDGNEWMHSAGATISAHTNTKKHLSTSTRVDDWDFTFPPSPAGVIPGEVFETEKTLHLKRCNGRSQILRPITTDGDVSAYVKEADILHTGDTFWNGHFPFIDYSTGGNINGMIRAAETNVAAGVRHDNCDPGPWSRRPKSRACRVPRYARDNSRSRGRSQERRPISRGNYCAETHRCL